MAIRNFDRVTVKFSFGQVCDQLMSYIGRTVLYVSFEAENNPHLIASDWNESKQVALASLRKAVS